jgi:uncharacterized membrane protein
MVRGVAAMRWKVIQSYLEALARNDPVALVVTGVIVAFMLFMLAIMLRVHRQFRREDEQRRKKWGRKK